MTRFHVLFVCGGERNDVDFARLKILSCCRVSTISGSSTRRSPNPQTTYPMLTAVRGLAPHTQAPFARELERAYVPSPANIEAGIRKVLED